MVWPEPVERSDNEEPVTGNAKKATYFGSRRAPEPTPHQPAAEREEADLALALKRSLQENQGM